MLYVRAKTINISRGRTLWRKHTSLILGRMRSQDTAKVPHSLKMLRLLHAPKFVLRQYSPRTDRQILPMFSQVDSTYLQVRWVETCA
jgi:hypothetical protein